MSSYINATAAQIGNYVNTNGAQLYDLEKRSKKISTSDQVAQVGTISANGEREIGAMIAKAMEKVGNEGVITVEEAKSLNTELDVV